MSFTTGGVSDVFEGCKNCTFSQCLCNISFPFITSDIDILFALLSYSLRVCICRVVFWTLETACVTSLTKNSCALFDVIIRSGTPFGQTFALMKFLLTKAWLYY